MYIRLLEMFWVNKEVRNHHGLKKNVTGSRPSKGKCDVTTRNFTQSKIAKLQITLDQFILIEWKLFLSLKLFCSRARMAREKRNLIFSIWRAILKWNKEIILFWAVVKWRHNFFIKIFFVVCLVVGEILYLILIFSVFSALFQLTW